MHVRKATEGPPAKVVRGLSGPFRYELEDATTLGGSEFITHRAFRSSGHGILCEHV